MKLCINCRHMRQGDNISPRCAAIESVSPVDGSVILGFCDYSRTMGAACGPEGKLFWPKDISKATEAEQAALRG
jgi:hypothetical protein